MIIGPSIPAERSLHSLMVAVIGPGGSDSFLRDNAGAKLGRLRPMSLETSLRVSAVYAITIHGKDFRHQAGEWSQPCPKSRPCIHNPFASSELDLSCIRR